MPRKWKLTEIRGHGLRKDEDGKPGRHSILHSVHAADDQRSLLVVTGADFICPGVAARGQSQFMIDGVVVQETYNTAVIN